MAEHLGDMLLKLRTDSKPFDQGIKKAEKGAKGLEKNLKKTGAAAVALKTKLLGVGLAVAGVGLTISKAFAFAESGAKIQAQAKAFENLARTYDSDGKTILKSLREVSKGTVDTVNLIESANKALLLGIDPSKFAKLMEIARAASKATGDTITKSFEDITIGIGRQSRMILDNLGIIVKVEEANQKYAAKLGITASKLTDTQKKQAFLNATMLAGQKIIDGVGNTAEDSADQIAQIKVSLTELTNELKTTTLFFLNKFLTVLKKIKSASDKLAKAIPKINLPTLSTAAVRGGKLPPGGKKATGKSLGGEPLDIAVIKALPIIVEGSKDAEEALVDLDEEINQKGVDLEDMGSTADSVFTQMTNAVTGWASSFSGTLTDMLFGAELTFANIVESFGRMITQMIIQTQFIEPLLAGVGGVLSSGNAPSLGTTGTPAPKKGLFGLGFLGLAEGGVVTKPTMAMIGEGGESEAVIPLSKLNQGGSNVQVNIIGAPEGTKTEEQETPDGKSIDVILDEEVAKNIRPGTNTFKAFQKSFSGTQGTLIRR